MAMDEVTAYAAAWRTGGTWTVPPVPIPIDYVTRAAALWRGGEAYTVDPNIESPPLWWVNLPVLTPVQRLDVQVKGSAKRVTPPAYVPGQPLRIAIEALPARESLGYALEETIPVNWTVVELSHGASRDVIHGQVKWGPFCDAVPRTLTYTLLPPQDVHGPIALSGRASFEGAGMAIQGSGQLQCSSQLRWSQHPATGAWSLEVNGELGGQYVIESSTDLRHWTFVADVQNTTGSIQVPLSISPRAKELFYRARLEPGPLPPPVQAQ